MAATLLAVIPKGYASVPGYGTAVANRYACVISETYSGCESHAAGFGNSFSSTSITHSYLAAPKTDLARVNSTLKSVNPSFRILASAGSEQEFKAGELSETVILQNANLGHIPPVDAKTSSIRNIPLKAIAKTGFLKNKTADADKLNVVYNIRYTPGLSISGNRQAGGRVRGVGKQRYINTGQCAVELKTHRLKPGKAALQKTKFDFTDYRSTCRVLPFCA